MGQITKIEQQKNKNRVNIFIDDSFFCGLEKETAIIFGLKVGKEIDENTINDAIQESEQKRAFEKAMDYFDIRLHTKKELFDKLQKKGFAENSINGAIIKLEEYNYINDKLFAKIYIEQNSKYSKKILKSKLLQKGVAKDIIDETLIDLVCEEDEQELCLNYAKKYLKSKKITDFSDKQKLVASLARRGFSFDTINSTISSLKIEMENDL